MSEGFCQQALETVRESYVPVYVTVGFIGILVNSIVILLIVKTNQLRYQSIRLLMYLSCVDIFTCSIAFLRFITEIGGIGHNCTVLAAFYFIQIVSFYLTMYLFALTGIDRYLRIKYLEEYSNVFTKERFRFMMVLYLLICLAQSIVTIILNTANYIGYAFTYTFPVNVIVFVLVFISYSLSILKLREYQRTDQNISEHTRGIMKITKVYLYLFIATIGMIVIFQILWKYIEPDEFQIRAVRNFIGVWPSLTGIINGIAFIIINPPTRNLISRIQCHWRCCRPGPEVNPDIELNVFPPVQLSAIQ